MRKQHWALFVLAVVGVVLSGCQSSFHERMEWSSDGKKLAMVANGDLCLWRESDKVPLSLLKDGVQSVSWLPDSKDVLVISDKYFDSAEQVLATATASQKKCILESSEKIKEPLKKVHGELTELKKVLADWDSLPMVSEAITYVALRDEAEMKQAVGKHYKELIEKVQESVLQRYSIDSGAASAGPIICRIMGGIGRVRVSKDGRYALCLCNADEPGKDCNSGGDLKIFDLGQNKLTMSVSGVGPTADWSADSRSVVYVRLLGSYQGSGCTTFGRVIRRKVVGEKGEPLTEATSADSLVYLADIKAGLDDRLRCPADGSVMLSTDSLPLPARTDDPPCAELFALREEGPINKLITPVTRSKYKETLNYFELSPGGSRAVLVGSSLLGVLDLKNGSMKEIELPKGYCFWDEFNLMPSWKSDDELVFMVDCGKSEKEHIPALMQMSITDGKFQILSKGWPKKLLESLATGDK